MGVSMIDPEYFHGVEAVVISVVGLLINKKAKIAAKATVTTATVTANSAGELLKKIDDFKQDNANSIEKLGDKIQVSLDKHADGLMALDRRLNVTEAWQQAYDKYGRPTPLHRRKDD